jgi:glycosyltransferase involved in cell wall biosynthesis
MMRMCPFTTRESTTEVRNGIVEHRVRSLPVVRRKGFRFCAPAGRLGIPVVATNHFMPENLTPYLPLPARARRRVHDWARSDAARVFARAGVVTAPTPYAAALAERNGVPGPVRPISCGMDLTRFRTGRSAAEFRLRYGVPDRPTVGFVGRLDVEKNLDVVVAAMALVRARVPDAQLLLVGTGDQRRRLTAQAERLGLADALVGTGFVADADLPAAYAAIDVFVNAGTAELQSLVTPEAMASGVPVVGADASALPHLIHHGDNGFRFPPGDAAALAGSLTALLTDPARARDMGRRGRVRAQEHDQSRTVTEFEQLYARPRSGVPAWI